MNYMKGDITKVSFGLIIHGTNCSGGFGSGVAGAIDKKWPIVKKAFLNNGKGANLLGTFLPVKINSQLTIGNCYTQELYGSDGHKYANLDAIKSSLMLAYNYATNNNITTISMPKIGSGLGGLNWENEVEPIVKNIAEQFPNITTIIFYI